MQKSLQRAGQLDNFSLDQEIVLARSNIQEEPKVIQPQKVPLREKSNQVQQLQGENNRERGRAFKIQQFLIARRSGHWVGQTLQPYLFPVSSKLKHTLQRHHHAHAKERKQTTDSTRTNLHPIEHNKNNPKETMYNPSKKKREKLVLGLHYCQSKFLQNYIMIELDDRLN